jgi:hypothetical protein
MPLRISLALLIALLMPSFAHAGSACCEFCPDQYQQEGQFPYFEVIRTRRLIPDTSVVTADGWKRIFESCAQAERVNITASTDVTVIARAFLQLTDLSTPDTAIEYRWLLDDVPVGVTFRSRTSDRFPHADDINIVLPHVAAGRHRIAIEARLTGEGHLDLRLLFITAQGFPAARFPADSRIDAHSRTIGTDWSLAGPVLDLNSPEAARIYFQSYIEGSPGDAFDVRFVIDDAPQPPFHVVIPAAGGLPLWDHAADPIAAGAHTVRLEARAVATSTLTLEQVEAATAPVTLQNKTLPSLDATSSGSFGTEHQPLNCLILSAGGDSGGTGGLGGTPVCGKYDLLLDTTLPAAPANQVGGSLDDYTAFGDGYVEIDNRSDTSGIVTLTVEAIYEDRAANCNALIETANASCPGDNACATADFTLVEFAAPPGRSQKFLHRSDPLGIVVSEPHPRLGALRQLLRHPRSRCGLRPQPPRHAARAGRRRRLFLRAQFRARGRADADGVGQRIEGAAATADGDAVIRLRLHRHHPRARRRPSYLSSAASRYVSLVHRYHRSSRRRVPLRSAHGGKHRRSVAVAVSLGVRHAVARSPHHGPADCAATASCALTPVRSSSQRGGFVQWPKQRSRMPRIAGTFRCSTFSQSRCWSRI